MKLRAKRQGQMIHEIELIEGEEYIVGRSSACDLCLRESSKISRQHVKVSQDENGRWVAHLVARFGEMIFQGESQSTIVLDQALSFHISPYDIEFSMEPSQFGSEEEGQTGADQQEGRAAPSVPPPSAPAFLAPFKGEMGDRGEFSDDITADGVSDELQACLEILWENGPSDLHSLDKGSHWLLGRDKSLAQIILAKKYISKKQFEIVKKGCEFYIIDLGSSNGTFLNNEALSPHEPHVLKSYDMISVKNLKMQFTVKNSSLITNLPAEVNLESLPRGEEVLASHQELSRGASQGVHMLGDQILGPDEVSTNITKMGRFHQKFPPQKRKKVIRIATVLFILAIFYGLMYDSGKKSGFFIGEEESGEEESRASGGASGEDMSHLPPSQKMMIKDTFRLARTHYTQGSYQLCLSELHKLHQQLPFYKNSKEIESYCEEGRLSMMKQKEKERRELAAKELKERVHVLIEECKRKINPYTTLAQLEQEPCFIEVREKDPAHPGIAKLIEDIKIREQKRLSERQRQAQYQSRVHQGTQSYSAAKRTYKTKSLTEAIRAYENYLKSSFPDPKKLKAKATRELASIKKKFKKRVRKHITNCKKFLNQKAYKRSIQSCEKATAEDPSSKKAESLRKEALSQLRVKMRKIYDESVLEEQFGNIEAAKIKWNQIIQEDISSDEYFQRAKRKLTKYEGGI